MINVALIGFMATGKSTVGPALGKELGWTVVDTDKEVERSEQMTIAQMWREHGEPYFRAREARVVQRLVTRPRIVVVTGGGVVLSQDNVRALRENSFVVALTASVEILVDRVRRDTRRPLLNGQEAEQRIAELLREREGLYDFAHCTIDTGQITVNQAVQRIVEHPLFSSLER